MFTLKHRGAHGMVDSFVGMKCIGKCRANIHMMYICIYREVYIIHESENISK